MKMRYFILPVFFLIGIVLFGASSSFAAEEVSEGWTKLGTCEWKVSEDGLVTVRPIGNGPEGTMLSLGGYPPWREQSIPIKKIYIAPGVKTGVSVRPAESVGGLFGGVQTIEGLSNLDISNTPDISCMFYGSGIRSVDLSVLDTSNVTDMGALFEECGNLEYVNLAGMDTSNMKSVARMFDSAGKVTVNMGDFDLRGVNATNIFAGSKIESIDFSSVKTDSNTDLSWAFDSCYNLETANMKGVNSSDYTGMFGDCSSLTDVDFTGAVFDNQNQVAMFKECYKLLKVPKGFKFTGDNQGVFLAIGGIPKEITYEGCDPNIINYGWEYDNRTLNVTLKHTWSENYTIDKPATCTEEGSKSIHCSVCGTINESTITSIPSTGHDWEEPIYVWYNFDSTVIASRICRNGHQDTEIATPTAEVTKKPTYTTKGQTTYTATFTNPIFETQTKVVTDIPKLPKKANPMTVTAKTATVKYSALKKKTQTIKRAKVLAVSNAKGTVTYTKSKGNSKILINKKTGKVTVKKGLKKNTYKVSIKVKAAGNSTYKALTKTVTFKIRIR